MIPNNLLTNRGNVVKTLFSNMCQNVAFINSCDSLIDLFMLSFGIGGGGPGCDECVSQCKREGCVCGSGI